ncbi:fibronectin type III domain-containing protein, partial [Chloroflexota bacterium]
PLDDILVIDHIVSLAALAPGTTYYYVVMSTNAFGMPAESPEQSFTTVSDTTPPDISAIVVYDIGPGEATVNWNTNEAATSQVQYREVGETLWMSTPESLSLIVEHSLVLSGLTPDTIYEYRVLSSDAAGNPATSAVDTFTTLPDTTPPDIIGVPDSSVTETTAFIVWETNEDSTSQVAYSTTSHPGPFASLAAVLGAYGSASPEDPTLVFSHDASLSGLRPGTTYYYRVISKDAYGNAGWSLEYTFTTDSDTTPPDISGVTPDSITQRGAIIYWNTNEPATSQVEYGTVPAAHGGYQFTTPLSAFLVMGHGVSLSGLDAETTYYFRAISLDVSGNEAFSSEQSFQTAPDNVPPVISGVNEANVTANGAIIYWNTDELATSQVEYGTAPGSYSTTTALNPTPVYVHGVVLDGLQPETTYYYRVKSKDTSAAQNEGISPEHSFTTLPDTTPPVIVGVPDSSVTQTTALVVWETNEASTSQVAYSRTSQAGPFTTVAEVLAAYGSSSPEDPDLVFSHDISLSGLRAGTIYYYRVISSDAYGNPVWSLEYTFTTTADITPPVISGVTPATITQMGAIIYWNTNEPATSQVEYGTTSTTHGNYDSTTPLSAFLVMGHGVSLSGLAAETTYYYRVMSVDAYGNDAFSGEYTFDTALDNVPPVISGVTEANITDTGAIVYWNTDEPATSQVSYGTAPGVYDTSTAFNPALVYIHGVVLDGLEPSTTYYYVVKSKDGSVAQNEGVSAEQSFTTLPDTTPPVISAVQATNITDMGAIVYWNTNEASTSQVTYSTTSHAGDTYADGAAARAAYGSWSPENASPVYIHGVVLGGLQANTTYYYRVISNDEALNPAVSAEHSFTTLPDTTPPVISGITMSNITDSTVIIYWFTNEPAT